MGKGTTVENKSLQQLHEQLEAAKTDNAATQAQINELQQHLANQDDHDSLRDRLEQALVHFDEEHPDIAAAIRTAIDTLSSAGI